jgi:hypothetical protein
LLGHDLQGGVKDLLAGLEPVPLTRRYGAVSRAGRRRHKASLEYPIAYCVSDIQCLAWPYQLDDQGGVVKRIDHDEVRLRIGANPDLLYALVSNVPRTPEWSPEVVSCRWLGAADTAIPGARFRARNKKRWLTWSNRPVVEIADPGREFAFTRTEPGGGTIRWFFRFEPDAEGTLTTLGYLVLRPVPVGLHVILRAGFGVRDLQADLRLNMTTSLGRIAEIAEREARDFPSRPQSSSP